MGNDIVIFKPSVDLHLVRVAKMWSCSVHIPADTPTEPLLFEMRLSSKNDRCAGVYTSLVIRRDCITTATSELHWQLSASAPQLGDVPSGVH